MSKGLKNKQFTKEERKAEFCILAKTCSGKTKDRTEAQRMCAEAAANPSPTKAAKKSRKIPLEEVEPIPVMIADKTYMLPPMEYARICPCKIKATKGEIKKAAALAQMSDEQKEALSIVGQLQQDYGTG